MWWIFPRESISLWYDITTATVSDSFAIFCTLIFLVAPISSRIYLGARYFASGVRIIHVARHFEGGGGPSQRQGHGENHLPARTSARLHFSINYESREHDKSLL